MSDAPERIWTSSCGKLIVQDGMNKWPSDIEYRRADLPPTLAQAMQVPEVRELVEAISTMKDGEKLAKMSPRVQFALRRIKGQME